MPHVPHAGPRPNIRQDIANIIDPEDGGVVDTHKEDFELMLDCIVGSKAKGTMDRYNSHWGRFKQYCSDLKVGYLPAQPLHVAMFLAATMRYAVSKDLTFNIVKQASAAIFAAHQMAGIKEAVTQHPIVASVRNCAHRVLGHKTGRQRKEPVPLAMCVLCAERLLQRPCLYSLQVATFIMVSFAGLLRHDDTSRVQISDVTFFDKYMTIRIPGRKNDQFRHGSTVYIAKGSTMACPVRITQQLTKISVAIGPLLFKEMIGLKGPKAQVGLADTTAWSYGQARKVVLGELATTAGVALQDFTAMYGLHSFRSGGTTQAAEDGVDPAILQAHGGWRNVGCMQTYIKRPIDTLLAATKNLNY
jgi:integrase